MNGKLEILRAATAVLAVSGVLMFAGCDNLLEVEAPSRVLADDLNDPSFAPLLVRSATGDFNCALTAYIMTAGEVTDETMGVHIQSAEAFDYDRRTVNSARSQYATAECGSYGAIYQPLSTAIWQADNAVKVLEALSDAQVANRTTLIQTAQAYGGYGRVLLGEGFCTAAIDMSAELTSEAVFRQAEELFTKAIAGPSAPIKNMALVGRARVRLALKNTAGALADAQQVPSGFVMNAEYTTAQSRAYNQVFNRINQTQAVSVEPAFRNLTFMGVADSRVRTTNTGNLGGDGKNVVWNQLKYTTFGSPIPIARYAEARLIIAEISGGQTAVGIINDLHTAAGLPLFTSTDEAAIQAQVREERRRELWLEGHRFWDYRRLELPFSPAAGAPYEKGGFYGTTRCFPLPDIEKNNNPNIGL
jgi:hypothetical protein